LLTIFGALRHELNEQRFQAFVSLGHFTVLLYLFTGLTRG
jgi:hypothetical protein